MDFSDFFAETLGQDSNLPHTKFWLQSDNFSIDFLLTNVKSNWFWKLSNLILSFISNPWGTEIALSTYIFNIEGEDIIKTRSCPFFQTYKCEYDVTPPTALMWHQFLITILPVPYIVIELRARCYCHFAFNAATRLKFFQKGKFLILIQIFFRCFRGFSHTGILLGVTKKFRYNWVAVRFLGMYFWLETNSTLVWLFCL